MTKLNIKKYISPFILSMLAVLVLTAIVFLPSLSNGFVDWDDQIYIVENNFIRDLSPANLKVFFTREFASTYCPLVMISYALERSLLGQEPFWCHLTNYLAHIAVTASVFLFLYLVSGNIGIAFIASILFGIHPLHVESVAWASERKDLLSALFFMLTLISYERYLKAGKARLYWLGFLFTILSLLSKAMAVTIPFILLLIDYINNRRICARVILEKLPFAGLAVIFGAINFYFQSSTGATALAADAAFKIYFISKSVPFYISKLAAPIGLSAIYPYYNIGLRELAMIKFNMALILILLAAVFFSARYSKKIIFGSLFFAITLLPVLKIVPLGDAFAADRYMYLPSIGIFYLVAVLIMRMMSAKGDWSYILKNALVFIMVVWTVWLSMAAWQRCRVWKDSESLFLDVARQFPKVPVVNNCLGGLYAERGEFARAIPYLKKAVFQNTRPDISARAKKNLELAYRQMKAREEDASLIDKGGKAGSINRNEAMVFNNLGIEEGRFGNLDGAIGLFRQALEFDPAFADAYNNLGYAYYKKGDTGRALEYFKKALEIDPSHVKARENLKAVNEPPEGAEAGESYGL